MKKIYFTKMQGIGNDYIYINCFTEQIINPNELAIKISNRHFGVGSDGVVLILPSDIADIRMRMFNSDGSEAEMCGNASRCVAKFAYDNQLVNKNEFTLETGAGLKKIKLLINDGEITGATVDMGKPILKPELIPVAICEGQPKCQDYKIRIDNQDYKITAVSMGNPHAVVFMENINGLNLTEIGPKFENYAAFPKRINTEFVEIVSRHKIKMRVWERGAGETLACGTGACAAAVASCLNGLTDRELEVELLGGILHIHWNENNDHIYMSGPAETVFTGEYYWQQ